MDGLRVKDIFQKFLFNKTQCHDSKNFIIIKENGTRYVQIY
jgi:hypothetical protein